MERVAAVGGDERLKQCKLSKLAPFVFNCRQGRLDSEDWRVGDVFKPEA